MSSNEIWIVVLLGITGYWGTSKFIKFLQSKSNNANNSSTSQSSDEFRDRDKSQSNEESCARRAWNEILGVRSSASIDEIKDAYRKKISMYHPDKVSSMGPEFHEIAQRKSKEINSAYDEAMRLKQ